MVISRPRLLARLMSYRRQSPRMRSMIIMKRKKQKSMLTILTTLMRRQSLTLTLIQMTQITRMTARRRKTRGP